MKAVVSSDQSLVRRSGLTAMKKHINWANAYIAATILLSATLIAFAVPRWTSDQIPRFVFYFIGAILASNMKVLLPGITGTMSVNFVVVLVSIMDLNLPQVLAISCAGTVGQVLFRSKSRHVMKLLFNVSSTAISTSCCYGVYHSATLAAFDRSTTILLLFAAGTLFLVNTFSVSGIIALTERKSIWGVWKDSFLWTGAHHLVGAALAALFHVENRYLGWEAAVLTVPVVYLMYRSYSLHLGRLEIARKHALEMGDLHWRTIEALALAIDAKDETTHNHLLRVKVYATEISRELNLSPTEMQAIQAAALLHDIGKLAVPEYIISKPGKLTPEEFEKMKVHPVVGAEILERVRFPYPVVPIVRSHHEKWNGTGYPSGLKGEEIPIGARVLAAVDCLDALASDRQYRRALPLDEAMAVVRRESGVSFDPTIVEILGRRYVELEQMATSLPSSDEPKLSKNVRVDAGGGPASGYEESRSTAPNAQPIDFVVSIAAARQEFQSLIKVIEELGTSLSVDETLSLLAVRLKRMVPHDLAAIFVRNGHSLVPAYVSGEDARWFNRKEIAVGEGLTGWVVENGKPIMNGNPMVEPGYPSAAEGGSLRSAISIPLEASGNVIGALSLYSTQVNAFTNDHLRILLGLSPKAGQTLANALKHRETAESAATDDLTSLPNTRSLLLYLEEEIRHAENGTALAVMLIDLDGFKGVNDEFGHQRGDRVLRAVSATLRENCRESDYVARIGGDEFVIVMAGVSELDLPRKVQTLSRAVSEAGLQECGRRMLGMSAGLAVFPNDGIDAEQLLACADEQMYRMKEKHHQTRPAFPVMAETGAAHAGGPVVVH